MSTTHQSWRLHEKHSEIRVGEPVNVNVVIERSALQQLRSAVRSSPLRETGGVAYGRWDGDLFTITEIAVVPSFDRGPAHFKLDPGEGLRLAGERDDLRVVWHSHFIREHHATSDQAPSAQDLLVWRRWRTASGSSVWSACSRSSRAGRSPLTRS